MRRSGTRHRRGGRRAALVAAFANVRLDRRLLLAVPLALVLAWAAIVHSLAHIQKGAGTCAVVHPAFCAPRALQAPVTRDLSRDNILNNKDAARQLSSKAIHLVPLTAAAVRNLALSSGSPAQTRTLMQLSNRLARRDGPTQLWLIEDAVRRRDLSDTLANFDALFRTLPAASGPYMQQMGMALADPVFRKAAAPFVTLDNPWFETFGAAVLTDRRPIRFYGQLLRSAKALPDSRQYRLHFDEVLTRLAAEQEFGLVQSLYPRLPGADRAALARVTLPHRKQVPYRPVTWTLLSDGAAGAEMSRDTGEEMIAYAEPGTDADIATKLMFLAPGRYRLTWRARADEAPIADTAADDQMTRVRPDEAQGLLWTVRCATDDESMAREISALAPGAPGRAATMAFDVPGGCPAQKLLLRARMDETAVSGQWTVWGVSLQKITAGQ